MRIEIAWEDLGKALNLQIAGELAAIFKPLGFHCVTVDLEGFPRGARRMRFRGARATSDHAPMAVVPVTLLNGASLAPPSPGR